MSGSTSSIRSSDTSRHPFALQQMLDAAKPPKRRLARQSDGYPATSCFAPPNTCPTLPALLLAPLLYWYMTNTRYPRCSSSTNSALRPMGARAGTVVSALRVSQCQRVLLCSTEVSSRSYLTWHTVHGHTKLTPPRGVVPELHRLSYKTFTSVSIYARTPRVSHFPEKRPHPNHHKKFVGRDSGDIYQSTAPTSASTRRVTIIR